MVFPLSDDNSDRAAFPVVNSVLIALNVLVFVVFQALKALGLLRVSAEEEIEDLDMVEHGMPAYPTGSGGLAGAVAATINP